MKRISSAALSLLLCLALLCGCMPSGQPVSETAGMRTVTDQAGRTVEVPEDPACICALDPFCAPFVVAFGYGEQVKATIPSIQRDVLIQSICPSLKEAQVVKSGGVVNAEALLSIGVDLILLDRDSYDDLDNRAKIDATGIPYLVVSNATIDEALDAVELVGQVLHAEEEAAQYIAWYPDCLARAEKVSAQVPQEERPRLYHSVNEAVRTDYAGSLPAQWIAATGAVNVSLEGGGLTMEGGSAYTTLEQIFVWDPDLIICNEVGVANYILTDEKWKGLGAVERGEVYQMPIGLSRWGHPNSIETPLAVLWLTQLLYPDLAEIDLEEETRAFYQTYFDYTVSDEELASILSGDGMRTPKTGGKVE